MRNRPTIRVVYDLDPGDEQFRQDSEALLAFGDRRRWTEHGEHGEGWTLSYLEPDGDGVESYFIGGDLDNLAWARSRAEQHLDQRHA